MSNYYSLISFLFILLFSSPSVSQKDFNPVNYPDRYKLDLPKDWKKPKLMAAITEVLPKTIDQLKDMKFCTEGNAAFTVQLLIDSVNIYKSENSVPIVTGGFSNSSTSSTYTLHYGFFAALRVFDSLGKPVSQLKLVSPGEVFEYKTTNNNTNRQNVTYEDLTIYDTSGKMAIGTIRKEVPGPLMADAPQVNPNSVLTFNFLMDICELKIYDIRKMLRKLKE